MIPEAEKALQSLRDVIGFLPHPFSTMCSRILADQRFLDSPGGAEHHHNYKHGLLIHTHEVTRYARGMALESELTQITTAAIFHDYYKIFEYRLMEDGSIEKLPYRKLIGHVVGSLIYFTRVTEEFNVSIEETLAIGHALLAHHGRKEWGSPKEPQTRLAHILHTADMMSMQGIG